MYIDPNTGGMLFQVLAALFAVLSGVTLFFSGKIRMYFAQLQRRFRERPGRRRDQAEINGAEEATDS